MVNHGLAAKLTATDLLLLRYLDRLFSYKKFISYVQFSEFCDDWLGLICLNEDPHMDQLFTELLKRGKATW